MSRIVKAKWATNLVESLEFQDVLPKNNRVDHGDMKTSPDDPQGAKQTEGVYDCNLEAIKSANDLMKSAVKSSNEIRLKSQEKGYQQGLSQGYEVGLAQGMIEGTKNALVQAEAGLRELQELVDCINMERETARENREKEMISIAFEIARKIMKQQAVLDDNAIPKMLEEIVHEDEEGLKIYLSEYQKTLGIHIDKEIAEKIKKLSSKSKVIIIKDDDKIMVETKNGVVDMSLPMQLEQLAKAIDQNA
ncbi:FliH/SctL family protein [Acetobacterium bakii]|uniref:Flagellar assembly protein FliH/Type III secretion system HrpE domain-containing protein n=1 Tax=Acetobacterium bakii TaxID=52689 RepID=A0A0L6TZT7_9FIRM|nr:FliH/SctL family protein [Acetobacterium bakii]KNZ41758.1 hypothetical protein AKG39_08970 [Acetobacterium bakii]